ncbi:MAG: hypothetical protein AAGE84_18675 [Cyanobacteria bacterium P01_G01_bin.39]
MKRQLFLEIALFFLTLGLISIILKPAISQGTQVAMCGDDMIVVTEKICKSFTSYLATTTYTQSS